MTRHSLFLLGLLIFGFTIGLNTGPTRAITPADAKVPNAAPEASAFLSNNLLEITIEERLSTLWRYQYAPGLWGESNYREHFALYTPVTGIAESENFTVLQPFTNPGGGPGTVVGVLDSGIGLQVRRTVTVPPGDARYFTIGFTITNTTSAPIQDVRFFQTVDFDIPQTGDHVDDIGWYDSVTDQIGVRDDDYFRNIIVSVPRSDNHGIAHFSTELFEDWDDGQLNGANLYGPGDPAIGKQFNLSDLDPQDEATVSFTIWFGDPSTAVQCLTGLVTDTSGTPLSAVSISLQNVDNGTIVATGLTGSNGRYTLADVNPGSYAFRAWRAGYGTFVSRIRLGQGCSNQDAQLEIAASAMLLNVAEAFAPDIYQDTDNSNYEGDYLTSFTYDADWEGENNWQHLDQFAQRAFVYWMGYETEGHYIIEYFFFHPHDWGETDYALLECLADGEQQSRWYCHENDLEAVALQINKNTMRVERAVSIAHFWTPRCEDSVAEGQPNAVFIEAKGHGVYCRNELALPQDFPGGDGVIYQYTGVAEVPEHGNDREVGYALRPVEELITQIGTANGHAAYTGNTCRFRGNDYGANKAHTPWCQEVNNLYGPPPAAGTHGRVEDRPYPGDFFADPARLFATLFPDAPPTGEYVYNPYLRHNVAYDPATGGWISTPLGQVAGYVPANAVGEPGAMMLSFDVPAELPAVHLPQDSSEELYLIGQPVSLTIETSAGVPVTTLLVPAALEFTIPDGVLTEGDYDPETLQLWYWEANQWVPLVTEIDAATGIARAFTVETGVYALFGVRNLSKTYLPVVSMSP